MGVSRFGHALGVRGALLALQMRMAKALTRLPRRRPRSARVNRKLEVAGSGTVLSQRNRGNNENHSNYDQQDGCDPVGTTAVLPLFVWFAHALSPVSLFRCGGISTVPDGWLIRADDLSGCRTR